MRVILRAASIASFAALVVGASTGCTVTEETAVVTAPRAAVHPAYLHALSDLRTARYNLLRKGGDLAMVWHEEDAVAEIDKALREIKIAAIEDGKNIDYHPGVDTSLPYAGRLHKALDQLRAARTDISQEEDNAYAQGLRAKALRHIDLAIRFTQEGIIAADRAQ